MSTPFTWVDSTSWELPFFGLPNRIPWPSDAPAAKASEEPFDHSELVRAIELMGDAATAPWTTYRDASESFEALAEVLEDREFPEAATLLDQIESIHPGTAFVAFHRGVVARHDGRFEEAIGHYEQAAQKAPRVGMLWMHLGTLLGQEGQREKAVAALNNAVRCNPQDTQALEALASLRAAVKVLRDPNDQKSAVYVSLEQYAQISEQQLQQIGDNVDNLLQFAEFQLRNQLSVATGIRALEHARTLAPTDPRAIVGLANGYRMAERKDEARALVQELVKNLPDAPQAWYHLGETLDGIGDIEGARAAWEKLLTFDLNAQPALQALSRLIDGPSEAAEKWLTAYAEEKNSWVAWIMASNSARERGLTAPARDYAARAFALEPEREEVVLHYTAVLGEANDADTLISVIEPLVLAGKFAPRLNWNFAQGLKKIGRTNDAVHTLIDAASKEGAPEDFQQMAASAIDLWTGHLAQSELAVGVTKVGTLSRPIVLNLDGEDGAVVINAGQPIPTEGRFPWRIRLNAEGETRVTLQQGQSGSVVHPVILGTFAIKVPPVTGGAHTLQCLLGIGTDGKLLFKAVQGSKELPVRWIAPAAELAHA